MSDTVLLTGACGSIGPFAAEELLRCGYEVRATDLPAADFSRLAGFGCEVRPADLLRADQAAEVMRGVDAVVHTAARMNFYMTRPEYEQANYQVTVNACEAAAAEGVRRFLHYSTGDVYGTPRYSPVDEGHPFAPVSLYGLTKALGEQAAMRCHRRTGLPLTVIRPSAVYGPSNSYVMGVLLALPVLIREAGVRTLPVPRGGFQANLVHVEDVAAASVFLLGKDEAVGRAYNVADDAVTAFGDILEVLLASVGVRCAKVLPLPPWLSSLTVRAASHLPGACFKQLNRFLRHRWDLLVCKHDLAPLMQPRFDPGFTEFGRADYIFSNAALKSLGYRLRYPDLKEGWAQSVRWYVENGWIPRFEPV